MATKTNAAIVDGVLVPATEVRVLKALVLLGKPATVPVLARSMNDEISDASLYSYLGRLHQQRELVTREEARIEVEGTAVRRILWSPTEAAASHFRKEQIDETENSPGVARSSGQKDARPTELELSDKRNGPVPT